MITPIQLIIPGLQLYSFYDLLSKTSELSRENMAVAIDWVSWSRQARGTTSRLASAMTVLIRDSATMGKRTALLVRMNNPRARWHRVMKDWRPLVTHHCLCEYTLSRHTPHVKMRVYSTGLSTSSRTCGHLDETVTMSFQERDQSTQRLLTYWVCQWLLMSPEGEGEPLSSSPARSQGRRQAELGGPQQPPDSEQYPEQQSKTSAFPTDAKEREKARRKALKDQGKAHVVKERTVIVEEHFDDCGEDLSSLKGLDSPSIAWTSAIPDEDQYMLVDEAHSDIGDGLDRMLFSTSTGVDNAQYQSLGDVQQMSMQHQYMDIAEFRGVSQYAVLLTVRRIANNRTVSDLTVPIDLQHASQEMHSYVSLNNVCVAVLQPDMAILQQVQCWWEPWRSGNDIQKSWCLEIAQSQLDNSRHDIVCQSQQFDRTWSSLLEDDRVLYYQYDRCVCLLQDAGWQNDRLPYGDQIHLLASCPELIWPFRKLYLQKGPCTLSYSKPSIKVLDTRRSSANE